MDSLIGLYVPVHESSGDKTTNDTLVFKVYSNEIYQGSDIVILFDMQEECIKN